MRLTFDLYLEVNAGLSNPGFFENAAKYDYGQGIDGGGWVDSYLLSTTVIEQALPEGQLRLLAHYRAEALADKWAKAEGVADWRSIGRVYARLVENQPITYPNGAEDINPAIRCPKCSGPVIKRKSGDGPFWGCADFPRCTGARSYSK